jgi:hypothetical protein
MSGIVGGINLRSSGLVNLGSASDGAIFTGTGAGLPVGFEAAAGGGGLWQFSTSGTTGDNEPWTSPNFSGDVRFEFFGLVVSSDGTNHTLTVSIDDASSYISSGYSSAIINPTGNTSFDNAFATNATSSSITSGGIGNASGESADVILETMDNSNSATQTSWFAHTRITQQGGYHQACFGVGGTTTTGNITNFKLHASQPWASGYRIYTKITS